MVVTLTGQLICATPDEAARVRAALPEHTALSRAEPGCLSFEVTQSADPLVWDVAERFASRAAFEAHQSRLAASPWAEATSGIARRYQIDDT